MAGWHSAWLRREPRADLRGAVLSGQIFSGKNPALRDALVTFP